MNKRQEGLYQICYAFKFQIQIEIILLLYETSKAYKIKLHYTT